MLSSYSYFPLMTRLLSIIIPFLVHFSFISLFTSIMFFSWLVFTSLPSFLFSSSVFFFFFSFLSFPSLLSCCTFRWMNEIIVTSQTGYSLIGPSHLADIPTANGVREKNQKYWAWGWRHGRDQSWMATPTTINKSSCILRPGKLKLYFPSHADAHINLPYMKKKKKIKEQI